MGSHQSAKMVTDEWLTPPGIISALGEFDLDPCMPVNRPWNTAKVHYTKDDDGLSKEWFGRIWLNPPYGMVATEWMARLAKHGNGIALLFARTETQMFFDHIWNEATAMLFIKGRLYFHYVDGSVAKQNGGAPSVLIAYGYENAKILDQCSIAGKVVHLKVNPYRNAS